MMPTRISIKLITVARTGRRIERSGRTTLALDWRRSALVDDRDRSPVANLHLAPRHHDVGGAQPRDHLGLAVFALADDHLDHGGLAVNDTVHERLVAHRHDGLFGNEH